MACPPLTSLLHYAWRPSHAPARIHPFPLQHRSPGFRCPRQILSNPRKIEASHITLSRLGEKLRYDLKTPLSEHWQWITDGHTVWCYRPDLNLYTVNPADPWPKVLGPGPGLPGVEWKYITKFLAIAKMAGQTKRISDDLPPSRTCPGAACW